MCLVLLPQYLSGAESIWMLHVIGRQKGFRNLIDGIHTFIDLALSGEGEQRIEKTRRVRSLERGLNF
jgi:hypothetical protein